MSMINAMPMSSGIDYSLEEQDTGLKWIDGKKIYQKTVKIITPTVTATGTMVASEPVPVGARVDSVVSISGVIGGINAAKSILDVLEDKEIRAVVYRNVATTNKNSVVVSSNWPAASGQDVYITVQYTKITD